MSYQIGAYRATRGLTVDEAGITILSPQARGCADIGLASKCQSMSGNGIPDNAHESVLAMMSDEVDWPNAWKGGRLVGRDAMRDY